jgi:hypothetical protein
MKIRMFLFAMLFAVAAQAQNSYSALFLGNSYTGVNDLPSIVWSLTDAGGDTLYRDSNSPGGYTLQGHSTDANSLAKIHARPWDFVILQEQSQLPSFPQSQVQNQVYPYAANLNDTIKANDSCSVTVFYMTWGRKYGDASNCSNWPPVCTYTGMQEQLRMSYLNMANQNNALVAPCGSAFWESIKRDSTIELYNPDQSHPSYAGSYLNGCVFYATMYRKTPVGLDFYGLLDTATATFLQHVAHDVVFDSLTQWRIGLDDVSANYTYQWAGNDSVYFQNGSQNATTYHWDFGDGNTDSGANPVHLYTNPGTFLVTLIATDGCTSDTVTDTVSIIIIGRPAPLSGHLSISPNPSNGLFTVAGELPESTQLEVRDLQGRLMYQQPLQPYEGRFVAQLDLRHLAAGMYTLRTGTGGASRILLK